MMSDLEGSDAFTAEGADDISAALLKDHLEAALQTLQIADHVTKQEAMTVIRANAVDGRVFREAAKEGHLNVVKFLLNAKNRFALTPDEREACSNVGAADHMYVTPLHLAASGGHIAVVDAIISSGASVNVKTAYCSREISHHTPLHFAAKGGHLKIVDLLLGYGADIGGRDGYGRTALHWASLSGHFSTVRFLLMNNANADVVDENNASPLDIAVANGCRNIALLLLLQKNSLNKTYLLNSAIEHGRSLAVLCLFSAGVELNPSRRFKARQLPGSLEKNPSHSIPPLHVAVKYSRMAFIKILLQKGASVNAQDNNGNTPLHIACSLLDSKDIVEILLENGASLGIMNKNAETPLMLSKQFSVQQMLVENGADISMPNDFGCLLLHDAENMDLLMLLLDNNVLVDARDIEGSTALHYACSSGRTSVAQLLIAHGASVNTKNKENVLPLESAMLSKNPDVVQVLLENDADANVMCSNGEMPLHYARDSPEVVRVLLEYDVDINATDLEDLMTPLHSAVAYGHTDTVRLLLDHGAKVNAVDVTGTTPLHLAAERGKEDVVEWLLQNGADVTVQDEDGQTPLDLAWEHPQIRAMLQKEKEK